MTLEKTIEEDWKVAVKTGEHLKRSILSLIRAEFKNKQHEVGSGWDKTAGLSDKIAIIVLRKMIKQRKESIAFMVDRPDLSAKEHYECMVLQSYLPVPPSIEDMRKAVNMTIVEVGATSIKDIAKVMAGVQAKYDGQADGRELIQLIKKKLEIPV